MGLAGTLDLSPALAGWHSCPWGGHRWSPPATPRCSRLCRRLLQVATKSILLALGKSVEGHCPLFSSSFLPLHFAKNKQNRKKNPTISHWEKNEYKQQEEELFLSC